MLSRSWTWLGLLLVSSLFLAGCRTYHPTRIERVSLGDEVRVRTVDGEQLEFEVTFVGNREFGGGGARVAVERVASVEVRRASLGRSIFVGLFTIKQTRFVMLVGLIVLIVVVV